MYQKVAELQSKGQVCVLVTVTNTKGSTPREIGAKMVVTPTDFFGTIGGGALEWLALEKARELIQSQEAGRMAVPLCSKAHQCCGGFVELFFDMIHPRPELLIFGAGHVSQALLEVLAGTAFDCKLIDERAEWIQAAEMKKANLKDLSLSCFEAPPVEWLAKFDRWNPGSTYAVVMTHDHGLDESLIEHMAEKPIKYLGLIGSMTKRERFLDRLQKKGVSAEALSKLQCPMGVPIGGKAPKEVALSIGAQLVQILNSKT